jgi:hypothetical protein
VDDFEQRDDYKAYSSEVPTNASVTAYLNETVDGVRLRYQGRSGRKHYEIPQKYLQDGIISGIGFVKGKQEQQIKQHEEGDGSIFHIADKSEGNTSKWIWREGISSRINALIDDTATIQPNDPEFMQNSQYQQLGGGEVALRLRRNPQNRDIAGVFKNNNDRPIAILNISENSTGLGQLASKRFNRIKDALFPNDIQDILEKKTEAEREFIQEKMLDAFDGQLDYENTRPKGITGRDATMGIVATHVGTLIQAIANPEQISRQYSKFANANKANLAVKNVVTTGTLELGGIPPLPGLPRMAIEHSRQYLQEPPDFKFKAAQEISNRMRASLTPQSSQSMER